MQVLTQQELKKLYTYKPEKGQLINRSSRKPGGALMNGYRRISINYKSYLVHRLVWLYHYGEFPKTNLDHINSDRNDNRIENLREASHTKNAINVPNRSNNISGVIGVSLHIASNKWQARISNNKKNIALGIFSFFTDAVKARYNAELKLGYNLINNRSSAKRYLIENGLL